MNANHSVSHFMKGVHMNFSQLQSVVALAETGSFTEAAFAIDLTQSAVSHALATLERELGVTIFERNRKGVVTLTDIGKKILPHVRELLAQAEAIEQECRAARGQSTGKVRIGNIESIIAPGLLTSILTRFQSLYPEIEVVLFEGSLHEVGEWIENSVIDVGFVMLPATGVNETFLSTDELCILLPQSHPLSRRNAIAPHELQGENFVLEKTQCTLNYVKKAGIEPNKVKLRYQARDKATILAMVRERLGITIMPRTLVPKKLDGVVMLPLNPPGMIKIGLATRSQETTSRSTRLFIQTAVDWVQEQAAKPAYVG
jgi:DNA-binding transcriptional LysR family regulator